jgi:hypothetical protein
MPQIFKPAANYIARASLIGGLLAPVIIGYAVAAISRSSANTKLQIPINQPVPFSHQHHTWELGIDCRYCHTSVETSAEASFPSTETCMSCHSQIWTNSPLLEPIRKSYETGTPIKWNKVNKVPEFVYFNHSIHIARGINCNTCHGPVQHQHITYKGKEFQMQWCLQCHRAPERYLYQDPKNPQMSPREQVFNLYWKYQAGEELSATEHKLITGEFNGNNGAEARKAGKELLEKYGVQVQQLSDCSVCHN